MIKLLNEHVADNNHYREDDTYRDENNKMCLEILDVWGDIEEDLKNFCNTCKEQNIPICVNIDYSGDADGQYICENGTFEVLSAEETCLRETSDEHLIAEIERRGLSQQIHDNVVRTFMADELVSQFGFTETDAKEAAGIAYNHYASTEGATQYDGIEYAVENFQKRE